MGIRELKDRYGNVKTWQAFNRAIRAEIPGGKYVLDALGAGFVGSRSRERVGANLSAERASTSFIQ